MLVADRARAADPTSSRRRAALGWALVAFAFALPLSIAGLNASAAAVTLLLLWCDWTSRDVPWNFAIGPFSLSLLAYFIAAVVVSALGVDPAVSFRQLYKDFHKVWLIWLMLVSLRVAGTQRLSRALGLGCALAALYGIGQSLLLRTAGGTAMIRAHAFVHPVVYGELLGLCWVGGLAHWLSRDPEAPERRTLTLFLAICALALLLNQGRGALLGTAAGVAALGLADKRFRRFVGWALACLPIALVFWELIPSDHNIRATLYRLHHEGPHPSADLARLTFWRVGLEMFRDHLWHGVGVGNYKTLFARYFQGDFDGERIWGSAHNLYIHQAAERGLLGLTALGAVLWTMCKRSWDRARASGSAADLWALSACAAFLIMNLTEVAFQTEQVASLMLFIWAYAEARHGADANDDL